MIHCLGFLTCFLILFFRLALMYVVDQHFALHFVYLFKFSNLSIQTFNNCSNCLANDFECRLVAELPVFFLTYSRTISTARSGFVCNLCPYIVYFFFPPYGNENDQRRSLEYGQTEDSAFGPCLVSLLLFG